MQDRQQNYGSLYQGRGDSGPADYSNYRGILLQVLVRSTRVIARQANQCGYRENCWYCLDSFAAYQAQEMCREHLQDLYIVSVDLTDLMVGLSDLSL